MLDKCELVLFDDKGVIVKKLYLFYLGALVVNSIYNKLGFFKIYENFYNVVTS